MKTIVRVLSLCMLVASGLCYADQQLTVVDEAGQPVANATILLGFEANNPFDGNVLTTSDAGTASIPADWKAALPVTVQAPGYIAETLPVALPGSQRIQLTHMEGQNSYEVKGTTTNYGRLITDGKVDFSMVVPALTREQMLAFDLSTVISPQNDTLDIIGNSVKIPSNIALPEQTENYIFPIDFNKPDYRLYVRNPGSYNIVATHGQFPLQKVVGDIRNGKNIFDVINYFTFSESGSKTVNVKGNVVGADVAVNRTTFGNNVTVTAPSYSTQNDMVSLALIETAGLMSPSDMKRLTPGQTLSLKTNTAAGSTTVISLLTQKPRGQQTNSINILGADDLTIPQPEVLAAQYNFQRLSINIQSNANRVSPTFLPLIAQPTLTAGNVLKLDVPSMPAGLQAAGTYLVYSEIETLNSAAADSQDTSMKSERRTRLWEVFSDGWLSQVELPKIKFAKRANRTYRWEVLFMARPVGFTTATDAANKADLTTITHVTRNATNL